MMQSTYRMLGAPCVSSPKSHSTPGWVLTGSSPLHGQWPRPHRQSVLNQNLSHAKGGSRAQALFLGDPAFLIPKWASVAKT